jgi:hypothetical protein
MHDIRKAEILYQEFIEFRDAFLTKALLESAAHSTNMHGQKFRPVVQVPERKANYWREQIAKWNEYAEQLRQYPELGIEKSLYEPAPKYIEGANRVRVNVVPAITSKKISREDVIDKIKSTIEQFKGTEDTKQFIQSLETQLELLSSLPPKTALRLRRGGYEDLICTYNTTVEKKLMERVTANGVFFDDRVLRYGLKLGEKSANGRTSIYDNVQPLPITVYKDSKIYLISDIERATAEVRNPEVAKARTRESWNRANSKRRAGTEKKAAAVKGAGNAAGEVNPAGGDTE